MKQNSVDWTDVVRRTLNDAEHPLPQGGWERLSKELENTKFEAPKGRSHKVLISFAAAAAVVLVCIFIEFSVGSKVENVFNRVVMGSTAAVSEQILDSEGSTPSELLFPAVPQELGDNPSSGGADFFVETQTPAVAAAPVVVGENRLLAVNNKTQTHSSHRVESVSRSQSATLPIAETETFVSTSSADSSPVATTTAEVMLADDGLATQSHMAISAQPQSVSEGANDKEARRKTYKSADYDGLFADEAPVASHGGGSLAFAAGGIVTSASGVGGGAAPSTIVISEGFVDMRDAYQNYSYDHKQPLSFGLAYRHNLPYGFSLESGLVYTFLRSNVSMPGTPKSVSQKMHMLGIPLRANWTFVQRGGFSLYLGAGAMAEMCVDASFGRDRISEKEVQWSVMGALGAQYKVAKWLGLYFEPQVSHYFTQTALRTSRTDSSVALNLQLGVRFTY